MKTLPLNNWSELVPAIQLGVVADNAAHRKLIQRIFRTKNSVGVFAADPLALTQVTGTWRLAQSSIREAEERIRVARKCAEDHRSNFVGTNGTLPGTFPDTVAVDLFHEQLTTGKQAKKEVEEIKQTLIYAINNINRAHPEIHAPSTLKHKTNRDIIRPVDERTSRFITSLFRKLAAELQIPSLSSVAREMAEIFGGRQLPHNEDRDEILTATETISLVENVQEIFDHALEFQRERGKQRKSEREMEAIRSQHGINQDLLNDLIVDLGWAWFHPTDLFALDGKHEAGLHRALKRPAMRDLPPNGLAVALTIAGSFEQRRPIKRSALMNMSHSLVDALAMTWERDCNYNPKFYPRLVAAAVVDMTRELLDAVDVEVDVFKHYDVPELAKKPKRRSTRTDEPRLGAISHELVLAGPHRTLHAE